MPKAVRLKPKQIVAKLHGIEVKTSQGKDVLTACRKAGATDKSYYRWRREYGGIKVDQAKRLKQRELENARLTSPPVVRPLMRTPAQLLAYQQLVLRTANLPLPGAVPGALACAAQLPDLGL